jgi:hypothetical protein
MNDTISLHEGCRRSAPAPPAGYVSSVFVSLHYRRTVIPFRAGPHFAQIFGTLFAANLSVRRTLLKKLREKF